MRFSRKAAGLVAVGGVAALGIGLIGASGIGAAFTSNATATAKINVGDLDCTLSSTANGAQVSSTGHTLTVALGTITSSKAGEKTAPVKVTNKGTIPLYVTWNIEASGSFFTSWQQHSVSVPQGLKINPNNARTYDVGFQWGELSNDNLNTSGKVKYTAVCSDQVAPFSFATTNGATAGLSNGGNAVEMSIPQTSPKNSATGAAAIVNQPDSTLPTSEPKLVSNNYATGSPRMVITFGNGDSLIGYPSQMGTAHWEPHTSNYHGTTAYTDWTNARSVFSSETVAGVEVVMDTGQSLGTTNTIGCIEFGSLSFGANC